MFENNIFHMHADKPEINYTNSSGTAASFRGNKISVRCLANGQPVPLITWYDPHEKQITTGISSITGGSILTLVTDCTDDYGLYTCKAANKVGYDKHLINVTEIGTNLL
jgi:hypothetical protein